tara:strand:- start:79 stop:288 length:210 start_codon:yes stop_codon:yes gene_type:complete
MCIICSQVEEDKLKISEAWYNLSEMYKTMDSEHALEVVNLLWELSVEGHYDEDEEMPWDQIFELFGFDN